MTKSAYVAAFMLTLLTLCGSSRVEAIPDPDILLVADPALLAQLTYEPPEDESMVTGLIWLGDTESYEGEFDGYCGYEFFIYRNAAIVEICGREPASDGQDLYVIVEVTYSEHNEDYLSWFLKVAGFELFSDAHPFPVPVFSTEIINQFGYYEQGWDYLRFHFKDKFSGSCRLRVKTRDGKTVTLNLGQVDRPFFRKAVVTNEPGLHLRAEPSLESHILKLLKPGNELLLTGNESWYGKGKGIEAVIRFAEARIGTSVGWVAWEDYGEDKSYIKVIGFENF